MKLLDTITRAGRSLRQAKARTVLTSLAIGVGAFTVTLALAAGAGGRQFASDLLSSNTDVREVYVQQKNDAGSMDPTKPKEYQEGPAMEYGGGYSVKLMTKKDITALEKIDNVTEVTPIFNASAKYVTREGQKKFQATISAQNNGMKEEILAGNVNNLTDSNVIVPDVYTEALGIATAQQAIGEKITVVVTNKVTGQDKIYTLPIVAVTKNSILSAGSSGLGIKVSKATVANMYTFSNKDTPLEDTFLGAVVRAKDEASVEAVQLAIKEKGFDAQTAKDLMGYLFTFINVLMAILIGFGALAILTSIFGIINTQYISVLERTQQIGLMKALGMRSSDVGRLFKLEAAWIGFLGGVIGVGLALLVGVLMNPWITDVLSLGDTHLLIFEPLTVISIIILQMIVAVMAGVLPSRKAAKLDPIEALRTE